MIEVMGGVIFLFEPTAHDRVFRHVGREHLDGDGLARDTVPALVDRSHAPLGDLGDNFVISEDLRTWFYCFHGHLPESPTPGGLAMGCIFSPLEERNPRKDEFAG
jgi:hypothetical protein